MRTTLVALSEGMDRLHDQYETGKTHARSILWHVFGDRTGLAIFLGALTWFGLTWQIGVFINDNYTLGNALVAVAGGHLDIRTIQYGPSTGATPGMHIVDGTLYGRNYGLIFLALPCLWILRGLSVIADVRIALVGAWSLAFLGTWLLVGHRVEQERTFRMLGAGATIVLFAGNVAVAMELSGQWLPFMALQLSSMVAAALSGVVLYRLIDELHGYWVGAVTGLAVVFASPLAFWATIPKRHAVTGLVGLLALYWFYRGRTTEDWTAVRYRALTYVLVGMQAWIFPLEGFLLLTALVPLDLLTADEWRPSHLAVLAGAFVVGLVPFLLTNVLVTGTPLKPPGLAPRYTGTPIADALRAETSSGTDTPTQGAGGSTQSTESSQSGAAGSEGKHSGTHSDRESDTASRNPRPTPALVLVQFVTALLETLVDRSRLLVRYLSRGTSAIFDVDRLNEVFVRSGQQELRIRQERAINLSVLESMPFVAPLLALPLVALRTDGMSKRLRLQSLSPARATDLFAIVYAGLFTLAYLPLLPIHAMITVRYLLPVFPLAIYATVRLSPVRRALSATRTLAWTYTGGVLIGGQILLAFLAITEPALSEAVQLHGLLHLGIAGLVVAWTVGELVIDRTAPRLGAVVLGLAGAGATVFVVFARLEYFEYADFALPLIRVLTEIVEIL